MPSSRPSTGRHTLVVCNGAPGVLALPLDKDLEQPLPGFDSIKDALNDLAAGKFVVVLDDENRENEGDLICCADKATTELMAYMVEYTTGVICIAMEGSDLDRLKLPLMVSSLENEESMYTAFTITVDLREGISTGISASDRAKTIRHLADPQAKATDFRRPGHIFPLRYRPGGVLVRPGHTEASVDLARLAGSYPAGVLCEIVNKADGSMARTPDLLKYAKEHNLKCITIADLMRYRLRHDKLVTPAGSRTMASTRHGPMAAHSFTSALDGAEHVVFATGSSSQGSSQPVLVSVRREGGVEDLVGARSSSGGAASSSGRGLDGALATAAADGRGAVVYLRSRTAGEPCLVPEHGSPAPSDPECMDIVDYGLAAQMLRALGHSTVRVDAADVSTISALRSCGLTVTPVAVAHPSLNGHSANGTPTAHSLAGAR